MAHLNQTPAEKALHQNVISVITSKECKMISFSYEGILINQFKYAEIANYMRPYNGFMAFGGAPITVKIEAQPTGVEAEYDPKNDVVSFPSSNYGVTPFQKMAIVHEVTHAILDSYGKKYALFRLDNEMIAYIASAMYNINCGSPFLANKGTILYEADELVKKIYENEIESKNNGINIFYKFFSYNISKSNHKTNIYPLRMAIKNSSTYSSLMSNPALTYADNGIGF